MGDIVARLPFGEERAWMIATTETTSAYARGQRMAGEALRKEYPDVDVVKQWFTNNDDLVCPICGPLDGEEIDMDDDFTTGIADPPAHPNCRCWISYRTRIK
jgi:SPP1 gp7 family putative phage head morphogenesis protein